MERTCHYVARVGLAHVKSVVIENDARRKALYERLLFSLEDYKDPWAAVVTQPAVRREYDKMEDDMSWRVV